MLATRVARCILRGSRRRTRFTVRRCIRLASFSRKRSGVPARPATSSDKRHRKPCASIPSASHTLSYDNGHETPLVKNQLQASLNELRLRRLETAAEFLHDVDRVSQHREHQPLFARKRSRADRSRRTGCEGLRPETGADQGQRLWKLQYSLLSILPPPSEVLEIQSFSCGRTAASLMRRPLSA